MGWNRFHMVNEIVKTEEKYVASLESLLQDYVVPMKESRVLPAEKIESFFQDFLLILGANRKVGVWMPACSLSLFFWTLCRAFGNECWGILFPFVLYFSV